MGINEIPYNEKVSEVLEQINKGAFITVKSGEEINTMTIGWGMIGFIWNKPIFQILVRKSRHTYKLLENSDNFTVSVPININLKEQLAFCGSKSGRDIDKFKECNITPIKSQKVDSPIIRECNLHYECKIIAKQRLEPDDIVEEYKDKYYSNNDYHTMYYGEIVACYLTEE